MAHIRKQIRDRFELLLTGLPTTGGNVFASYSYALSDAQLPGLKIYTHEEDSDIDTMEDPAEVEREIEVTVEGNAKIADTVDDVLDSIAEEVEQTISREALSGLVHRIKLIRTTIEIDTEAEKPVGQIAMTYLVVARTIENSPGTPV